MARYDRPKAANEIVEMLPSSPQPNIILGMVLMCAAMIGAPVMDIIAKYLGTVGEVAPGVVTFGRFVVQAVILFVLMVILVATSRRKRIWPKNIAVNLLRGAMMGMAAFLFFTAVTFMPVADAIAIFFVEPFILTTFSALLLGESVRWRRRIAVLVGFGGALLIIQPSFQELGAVAFLPVVTAFIFALYLILTRKYAGQDDPFSMQLTAGVGGSLMMLFAFIVGGNMLGIDPLVATWPQTSFTWSLVVALGLMGTASHLLIVFAFARAPASILAPFQYIEIVSGTILGYLVFRDFPDLIKWIGIFIIAGSGIYIFWREAMISKSEGVS